MVKVDLITGFLGAGKTTFIKNYIEYLKDTGEKILVIENEFGMVNVDAKILREDDLRVDDLTGCCMCCTGKEKFKDMLLSGSKCGYDRIIVEPSGIYDVDEFFNVVTRDEISQSCIIGNIITIIDACDPIPKTREGRYLLYCQILSSGMVLISKTDTQTAHSADAIGKMLDDLFKNFGGTWDDTPVYTVGTHYLTADDFAQISDAGYKKSSHEREKMAHDEIFEVCEVLAQGMSEEDLSNKIHHIFKEPACGKVMRIKGTAILPDKEYRMVNATGSVMTMDKTGTKGLLVVIGQGLNRDEINSVFKTE